MTWDLSERRLERRLDSQPDEVDDICENMVLTIETSSEFSDCLPRHGIKAKPHIESRSRTFQKLHIVVHDIGGSGFGWDLEKKLVTTENSISVAEDIGRQLLTYGRRIPVTELFARIDAVDTSTIKRVAYRFICDQFSAFQPITDLKLSDSRFTGVTVTCFLNLCATVSSSLVLKLPHRSDIPFPCIKYHFTLEIHLCLLLFFFDTQNQPSIAIKCR
ncbi:hypothetical protein ZIOFF_056365 [Zingiber officinale]|uniref:Uncharacterized protein n=1 Tax=Zingiber officinale TaxID=94328 RepID=A0A8J5FM27_ZINOF|nr:hypothetical protein ZIOFF_056365 [Zingiber officinale]